MASDSLCQARAFVGVRAGMEPKPLSSPKKKPRGLAPIGVIVLLAAILLL